MKTKSKKLSQMSRDELLDFCRELYGKNGVAAFTFAALKSVPTLYFNLYAKHLPQRTLLKELGIEDEFKQWSLTQPFSSGARQRWSWDVVVEKAKIVMEVEGRLPPAMWFQKNGHASIVTALYYLGHTWDQLQEAVGDFSTSNFVESRSGKRWLSHAEASLSNFLYARGIEHWKGERYDDAFADAAPSRYAIYDMHFVNQAGERFDVEVWGDRPNGHNETRYADIREAKEAFNSSNSRFLGIHFKDCYVESVLATILERAIGRIEPFQFDKSTDSLLHSTHWSNADELLDFCRDLAAKMPDGKFPAEDWLRKRGRWADRDGEVYNTLSAYIKQWIGGIRKLRELIGQSEHSTKQWDRETAIAAYKAFYDKHGMTPHQMRHSKRRATHDSPPDALTSEAINLAAAISKYAGGVAAVHAELRIEVVKISKWSKATLLSSVQEIAETYGLSPHQLKLDHQKGRVDLSADKAKWLGQVADAIARFPGGLPAIYSELGIDAPKRIQKPKWKDDSLLAAVKEIVDTFGMTPHQLKTDNQEGKVSLDDDKRKWIGRVISAMTSFPGGPAAIYSALRIDPPKRKSGRRRGSLASPLPPR
jgi:hypothetical protein